MSWRCFFRHEWAEMCRHADNGELATQNKHRVMIYYMCIDCYKAKSIFHEHNFGAGNTSDKESNKIQTN